MRVVWGNVGCAPTACDVRFRERKQPEPAQAAGGGDGLPAATPLRRLAGRPLGCRLAEATPTQPRIAFLLPRKRML
jgi:hypothetical protein